MALARKRNARRLQRGRAASRSEPEAPRLFLSTFPFVALLALLAVLALSIFLAANPAAQPAERHAAAAPHEDGVAARGWLQEAQKEFHR